MIITSIITTSLRSNTICNAKMASLVLFPFLKPNSFYIKLSRCVCRAIDLWLLKSFEFFWYSYCFTFYEVHRNHSTNITLWRNFFRVHWTHCCPVFYKSNISFYKYFCWNIVNNKYFFFSRFIKGASNSRLSIEDPFIFS